MDLIKQAAINAGIEIIDHNLVFSPPLAKSYSKITNSVCHHDVWPGGTMKSIHVDHKKYQRMRGTGYHGRFPTEGGIELGRPHGMVGGHCKQEKMNYKSTGFVWEGNLDLTMMSDEQFRDSTKFMAEYLKLTGNPISSIDGHGDYANKSCPGKNFPMKKFKEEVQRLMDDTKNVPSIWALDAQAFVTREDINISDGRRPHDICTREEQWVMQQRLYDVLRNEFMNELNKLKEAL